MLPVRQYRGRRNQLQYNFNTEFDRVWNETISRLFPDQGDVQDYPRLRIESYDDRVEVIATVPGLHEENVHVHLDGTKVTISGDKREEMPSDCHGACVYNQIVMRSFTRTKDVSPFIKEITEDTVTAKLKDGLLTVTLPRKSPIKDETREVRIISE